MDTQQQSQAPIESSPDSADFFAHVIAEPDERWRVREERAAKIAAANAAADQRANLRTLRLCAGGRYVGCTFDSFNDTLLPEQRRIKVAAREYASDPQSRIDACEGLILHGAVGTGKDHLAFCVCCAFVQGGFSVRWTNGVSWFASLRDRIGGGSSESGAIAELLNPDVLCISDPLPPAVDKGDALTRYQSEMLYHLVDARYVRRRLTICTVNVNDDREADRRLSEPVWDRLCDGAWKLCCKWPSYRRPAREVK